MGQKKEFEKKEGNRKKKLRRRYRIQNSEFSEFYNMDIIYMDMHRFIIQGGVGICSIAFVGVMVQKLL